MLARIRNLEAEVQGREDLLGAIEGSMDGLWDWNILTGDDYLSPVWKRSLGYEPSELPDRVETWQRLVHPEDLPKAFAAVEAHLERGEEYSVVLRYLRKDGSIAWMLARGVAFRNDEGEWARMIGTHTELTALKEAEQSLAAAGERLEAEVRERTRALDQHVQMLQTTNADLERFVRSAAHDLQEPVRAIVSFAQLLEEECRDSLSGDAAEYMGYVQDGARRLQGLIQDLHRYGRVGRRIDEPEATDLGRVAQTVLESFEDEIEATGFNVSVGDLPVVDGVAQDLEQLFSQLVDNAIKYRREGESSLRITAEVDDAHWRISFEDNGVGIDEEYQEQVFEVFRRLHSRSDVDGNGIGLAIVRRAAMTHGGDVALESEAGRGSTFHVTLPRSGAVH